MYIIKQLTPYTMFLWLDACSSLLVTVIRIFGVTSKGHFVDGYPRAYKKPGLTLSIIHLSGVNKENYTIMDIAQEAVEKKVLYHEETLLKVHY